MEGVEETVAHADRGGTTRGKLGELWLETLVKTMVMGKLGISRDLHDFFCRCFSFWGGFHCNLGFGK